MSFLEYTISELLNQNSDLSGFNIILPNKRPEIFIKQILQNNRYTGMLPCIFTIEEFMQYATDKQLIKGVSLWLFAYDVYRRGYNDDFSSFLKWFPTLSKDWEDMLKFSEDYTKVLGYMQDEERIKNWGENLNQEQKIRYKHLDFWKKNCVYLPELEKALEQKGFATMGMMYKALKQNMKSFIEKISEDFVFCGFNAMTPIEETLVKELIKYDKAQCFFDADAYYMNDEKQEAGKFLRTYKKWNVFNENRPFRRIENSFSQPKAVTVYEAPGNITQTKILPKLINSNDASSKTAVVLLDENLLTATLEALGEVKSINITMGVPIKNLAFSTIMKAVFHLHKQISQKKTYYHKNIVTILGGIPCSKADQAYISEFLKHIKEHNMVYISAKVLEEKLGSLSFFKIFQVQEADTLLDTLIDFCTHLKGLPLEDIQYENISYFEQNFKTIKNQIQAYHFPISIDVLEVLMNQMLQSESINFRGEPLSGLQVMGLLETRLLSFDNVILVSANEGKLPQGDQQSSFLPFDVRRIFGLNTFLENDSIHAYHFYRLIQSAKKISIIYNSLSSGLNTGEKSRFIRQLEIESPHDIKQVVIEAQSEEVKNDLITIPKTPEIIENLRENWAKKISVSSLNTYLRNPIDFYFNKVLGISEEREIEEELSVRSYGTIVHNALEAVYKNFVGKIVTKSDLEQAIGEADAILDQCIEQLKYTKDFYNTGVNYIHKALARKTLEEMLRYDLDLVQKGHRLEIIGLEKSFKDVSFSLGEEADDKVYFTGIIDRIDRLDDKVRVIDYKTAKAKSLNSRINSEYFVNDSKKQIIQLCFYDYCLRHISPELFTSSVECSIWSFYEIKKGPQSINNMTVADRVMIGVKNLILEILNPEIPFLEKQYPKF